MKRDITLGSHALSVVSLFIFLFLISFGSAKLSLGERIDCSLITGGTDNNFCTDTNSGGTMTWSEAINGTLYLSSNPAGYISSFTEVDPLWFANWSNFSRVYANITLYNTSWSSTFNSTYDTWFGNYSGYNASWNNITNVSLTSWLNAINGTLALNSSLADYLKTANWNATNTSYYLQTNPFSFYNSTTFPQNASLMTYANWNATNTSYYLTTNPFSFYNITTAPIYLNDTFNANYSNFTRIYGNVTLYNGSEYRWDANASNFTVVYGYALNSTNTFTANYSNFSRMYANITDYNTSWSSITNTSYDQWNNNASNFTTLYGNQLGNASGSGISWATANNGTLLNYTSALNGTLVQNTSLADYLKTANWNSTNTTYHTWFGNYSGYNASWNNITNVSYLTSETFWNGNATNFTTVYGNLYTNYTNNAFNQSNFSVIYGYALNSTNTFTANYSNFTTIYGNALGWANNASNFTAIYGYALNSSLWTLNYSNFSTLYSNQFNNYTNNAFNQSNFSVVYAYTQNATGGGISWATAYNGTLAKTDALNTFGAFNQTFNTSNIYLWALLNRTGIGTISPQNTLNVVGDANATTVYSANNNLTIGYLYATNSTGSGGRTITKLNADIRHAYLLPNNRSVMTLTVAANTNYSFGCDWIGNTSVATTGIVLNVTAPSAANYFWVGFSNPTTSTAPNSTTICPNTGTGSAVQACTSFNTAGVVANSSIYMSGRLYNGANAGVINFTLKSEINGTEVMIRRESYCWIANEI